MNGLALTSASLKLEIVLLRRDRARMRANARMLDRRVGAGEMPRIGGVVGAEIAAAVLQLGCNVLVARERRAGKDGDDCGNRRDGALGSHGNISCCGGG